MTDRTWPADVIGVMLVWLALGGCVADTSKFDIPRAVILHEATDYDGVFWLAYEAVRIGPYDDYGDFELAKEPAGDIRALLGVIRRDSEGWKASVDFHGDWRRRYKACPSREDAIRSLLSENPPCEL